MYFSSLKNQVIRMEKNPEERKPWMLLGELQAILTLSYGTAVAIGMLFQYYKYERFGINIFEYADVFDFLIAPFSDPKILLYTLFALAATGVAAGLDTLWQTKSPKSYSKFSFGLDKKKWWGYQQAILALGVLGLYLSISANKYAQKAYEEIMQKPRTAIRYSDNERKQVLVIGKTNEVLFAKEGRQVKVIPISSLVKEYEIMTEVPTKPEKAPIE